MTICRDIVRPKNLMQKRVSFKEMSRNMMSNFHINALAACSLQLHAIPHEPRGIDRFASNFMIPLEINKEQQRVHRSLRINSRN